ncbi:MAG: membrane protein insertion efficiency factor YidD [Bdellovibrionales bacterium]|nr:membrane protein insertion efficiency factor YidD [Bdellovibrionales bacterium]
MNFASAWTRLGVTLSKPIKFLLQSALAAYSAILSPWMGGVCRFYPSCSVYAKEALETHNISYSLYLISKRILSCRPGGRHGYDPVPPHNQNCHHASCEAGSIH